MKKIFVAMMVLVAMMISIEAMAEDLTYVYFGGFGVDAWLSDIYLNDDGAYEQDILLGDHWEFKIMSDDPEEHTAEWYSYCDGTLIWFDKDYDDTKEQSVQGLEGVVEIVVEKYYDGMDEWALNFFGKGV